MTPTRWNKLVRDRMPEVIRAGGVIPVTRILSEEEYRTALRDKVVEECGEFCGAPDGSLAEEAADILEAVLSLCRSYGIPEETVAELRARKNAERGGFRDRVFLIETL